MLLYLHLLGIEAVLDVGIHDGEGRDVDSVHDDVHQIGIGLRVIRKASGLLCRGQTRSARL